MRTMKYLLVVVGLASVLGVYSQSLAQRPEPQMQSTSVMVGTGSTLPQAAVTGVVTTESPSPRHAGRVRKEGNPFDGGGTAGDVTNPIEPGTPIGDGLWVLLAIAAAFAFGKWIARTKPLR